MTHHHPTLTRPVFVSRILSYSFPSHIEKPKLSNLIKFASVCNDWNEVCLHYSFDSFFPIHCLPRKKGFSKTNCHLLQHLFVQVCKAWNKTYNDSSSYQFQHDDFFKFLLSLLVKYWVENLKKSATQIIKILPCHQRRSAIYFAVWDNNETLLRFLLFELFEEHGGIGALNLDAELECSITRRDESAYDSLSHHSTNTFESAFVSSKVTNVKILELLVDAFQKFAESKENHPRKKKKMSRVKKFAEKNKDDFKSSPYSVPFYRKHLWYSYFRETAEEPNNILETRNLLYQASRPYDPPGTYDHSASPIVFAILYQKPPEFIDFLLNSPKTKCDPNFIPLRSGVIPSNLANVFPIHACLYRSTENAVKSLELLLAAGAETSYGKNVTRHLGNNCLSWRDGVVLNSIRNHPEFLYSNASTSFSFMIQMLKMLLDNDILEVRTPVSHLYQILNSFMHIPLFAEKEEEPFSYHPARLVSTLLESLKDHLEKKTIDEQGFKDLHNKIRESLLAAATKMHICPALLQVFEKYQVVDAEFLRENIVHFIMGVLDVEKFAPGNYTSKDFEQMIQTINNYLLDVVNPTPKQLSKTVTFEWNGNIKTPYKGTILHKLANCMTERDIHREGLDVVMIIARKIMSRFSSSSQEQEDLRKEFVNAAGEKKFGLLDYGYDSAANFALMCSRYGFRDFADFLIFECGAENLVGDALEYKKQKLAK